MQWPEQMIRTVSEGFRNKNPDDFGGNEIGKSNTSRFNGVVFREINRFSTDVKKMSGTSVGLVVEENLFCMGIPIESVGALKIASCERTDALVYHASGSHMHTLWKELYNTYDGYIGFGVDCLLLGIVAIWRACSIRDRTERTSLDCVLYDYLFMQKQIQTDFALYNTFGGRVYPKTSCFVLTCVSLPKTIEKFRTKLGSQKINENTFFTVVTAEDMGEDLINLRKTCHYVEIGKTSLTRALPQFVCCISKLKRAHGLRMDTKTLEELKGVIKTHQHEEIFKFYYDLLYFLSRFEA